MKTLFAIALTLIVFSGKAQDWELLGSQKVNFGLDHDEIPVTSKEGKFSAIQIKVLDGGINMHSCIVYFGNGEKQEVELRYNFAPGSESRVVDLSGNKRFINRIAFWYDTKNLSFKRATVEVYGRR